jgi:uncharacterized membrane protein
MAQDLKHGLGNGAVDRLKTEARGLVGAVSDRAVSSVREKVEDATSRLTDYVEGGAGPGFMAAVTGAKEVAEGKGPVRSMLGAGVKGATEKAKNLFGGGGGKGGQGKKLKVTNIAETIDVGVPIRLAYNQWTQFTDFPSFTKKIEDVQQEDDPKLKWKAQIFWSHRHWEATILEQVPDDRIVWRSKGEKGHVDGAVTFHELSPNLTRILLVLEYHPQGFFEHTGNLWRAQGRRARLELKHFRRHMMSEAILHPEEVEGWRGVIKDGQVVKDHETAVAEEEDSRQAAEGLEQDEELADEEYADEEYADDQDEDSADENQDADEADEETAEVSANGRSRDGRTARTGEGTAASGRGRQPAERQQRSGRSTRVQERPQRTVRRRTPRGE